MNETTKEKVIELRKQGMSKPMIAKTLGVSFNSVRYNTEPKRRLWILQKSKNAQIKTMNRLREMKGNKCELCGYNKCKAVLHFHHIDPKTKSFGIGKKAGIRSIKTLIQEAEKCQLLCANCHGEITWLIRHPNL
jgi:hypothetical protein